MIKCNRCGSMTAAGAGFCQICGASLPNAVENVNYPQAGNQGQAELPAWLESLRAGERTHAPGNNASNFSAADFVEEGSLPSWMRAERNESRDNTGSNPPVMRMPLSSPDNNAQGQSPAASLAAQSLIDEQSLPSWMQENNTGAGNVPGTSMPAPSPLNAPGPGGLAASSLVQPDNMPDWMKSLQQQQPAKPAATPAAPARPVTQQAPSPQQPLAHGFSAHDLVDPQALPSWMAAQTPGGSNSAAPIAPTAAAPQPRQAGAGPVPENGFAASSLLDVNALPQWLREGEKSSPAYNAAANQQQGAWPNAGSPNQPAANQQQGAWPNAGSPNQAAANLTGNGVAASSFIDMEALPGWLRSNGEQSQMGNSMQQSRAGIPNQGSQAGVPLHVDNVRVPSRPRNDANQNESTEVAANVFASMLGVASGGPAPSFPVPSNTPYGQAGQGQGPYVGGAPAPAGMMPTTPSNMSEADQQMPGYGAPMTAGQADAGMQGMQGGYPSNASGIYPPSNTNPASYAGNGAAGGYQNYPVNMPLTGPQVPGNANARTPLPTPGEAQSGMSEQKTQAKSGKRSIFDVVREWFER